MVLFWTKEYHNSVFKYCYFTIKHNIFKNIKLNENMLELFFSKNTFVKQNYIVRTPNFILIKVLPFVHILFQTTESLNVVNILVSFWTIYFRRYILSRFINKFLRKRLTLLVFISTQWNLIKIKHMIIQRYWEILGKY